MTASIMNSVRPSQRGLMYGPSLNPTLSEAERHYRKALRLCRWWAPVYRDEAAANLIGLGTLAQIRGRFRKTIRLASRAIREAGRAEDARHVIAGERLMGAAYKVLGRRGEAEAHIKTALEMSNACGAGPSGARPTVLLHFRGENQLGMVRPGHGCNR